MNLTTEPWQGYLCIYPIAQNTICESRAHFRCNECCARYCRVHGAEGEECPHCLTVARKEARA